MIFKRLLSLFLIFCMIFCLSCTTSTVAVRDKEKDKATTENITETGIENSAEADGESVIEVTEPFSDDSETEIEPVPETEPEEIVPAIAYTDIMLDVPYISQKDILPNGCEAVCATMLMQYYGIEADALDFARYYMLRDVFIKDEEGRVFGPDPEEVYVGDPEIDDGGFGCYPSVITESLERCLPEGYIAIDISGMNINEITNTYLADNIPVALWMTVDMKKTEKVVSWYDKADFDNEEPRVIEYPANLHVMVLCGYDGENFIFSDPYDSRGVVKHSYEDTLMIYESMGRRAFAINKNF